MGVGLVLLFWLGGEKFLSLPGRFFSSLAGGATPSARDASYGFRLIGINGETLYSFMTVVGTALLFFAMLGIVNLTVRNTSIDRRTALFVAACLALIALVGSGGRLAHLSLWLYGAGLGLIGTLVGGAACGAAVRRGSAVGLLTLVVSVVDLLSFALAPSVAELQLVFAVITVVSGVGLYADISSEIRRGGDLDAVLMSPPLVALAVAGAIVAVPLVLPMWPIVQILAYAVAFAGGLFGANR
jgi:hypothetical protein